MDGRARSGPPLTMTTLVVRRLPLPARLSPSFVPSPAPEPNPPVHFVLHRRLKILSERRLDDARYLRCRVRPPLVALRPFARVKLTTPFFGNLAVTLVRGHEDPYTCIHTCLVKKENHRPRKVASVQFYFLCLDVMS